MYSHELLYGLAAAHPDTRFRFCYRSHRFWRALRETMPPNVSRRLLAEPLGPRGADVFHGLNQRLPGMRLKRTVATFHDLFVMTGEYSTAEFRARFTAQARDAARRADAIIAVSEFTRRQVVELLGVEPERVTVVHHGVRPLRAAAAPRENIVLSVGAIQKRKNIARLVEAFETASKNWRLVLAGSAGYGAGAILERIQNSPARARISVTGYISSAELADLYARASVFAFPSLDEGFGMPVLEAMAAGLPVIASNSSALPEVAADAAVLVDPEDTAALAEAIGRMTEDQGLRTEYAARGIARAELFTWEKAVRQTWDVYEALLGRARA